MSARFDYIGRAVVVVAITGGACAAFTVLFTALDAAGLLRRLFHNGPDFHTGFWTGFVAMAAIRRFLA